MLNAFLDLVFTYKIGFHEYEICETNEKVWIKENTLMEKYLTREHLNTLDRHKSNELTGCSPKCWGRHWHWDSIVIYERSLWLGETAEH